MSSTSFMFTNFCTQFTFLEKMADEPCPTSLHLSTDMWAEFSASLEISPSARDPPSHRSPNRHRHLFGSHIAFTPSLHLAQSTQPTPRLPRVDEAPTGRRFAAPKPPVSSPISHSAIPLDTTQ